MASKTREKYGKNWPADADDLQIEMGCIRNNIGNPSEHYEAMRRLLWPGQDTHRWVDVCRDAICSSKVTVLMGCGSSGKTWSAAWYAVCKWMVDPENTCVLVSSTDMRGLRMRVWGEITRLWEEAIQRFSYLPGHLLDSRPAISYKSLTDDDIDDRSVRDMRQSIVGIPCIQGGKFVGIGKFIGLKQKNVLLVADECQFMGSSFLSAFSNLNKNPSFQAICLGNPNDVIDPLGKASEPLDGWGGNLEPEKTATWKTRFMEGICVNLVGTDSPNMDYPDPPRFPYLITRKAIAETKAFFGENSFEFYSQCKGVMKIAQLSRRVITRDLCVKGGAMDPVTWETGDTTKICYLDAAYGGDRCVIGHIEFGKEVGGKTVVFAHPYRIVPIDPRSHDIEEDQIAKFVREYCESNGIPPENMFHDSTGRGSLGTALARAWSPLCNPVEFGGSPTKRPVGSSFKIRDIRTGQMRPKLCDEHYSKFVTELWFSVRYLIEAGQLRGLQEDVMEEGCMRQWERTKDDKIKIEPKSGTPTQPGMKERVGKSPDLFDGLSIGIEGARRRGFQIGSLSNSESVLSSWGWMRTEQDRVNKIRRSQQLIEV